MSEALVARAFELSAVCGSFEPEKLCASLGVGQHPALKQVLLRELSTAVSEVFCDEHVKYGWFLMPDERLYALRQLLTRSQLDHVLAQAPAPWSDDLFGTVLRQMLSGRDVKIAFGRGKADNETLLTHLRHNAAILDAAQFAREVPALDANKTNRLEQDAKRQIQLLQRRRDLTTVLPRRHFGYDAIRRRLSNFLRGGTIDDRPVLLTGTGGIGKSAVLARMLQTWQTRKDAPVTVILDFDRPRFKSGSPFEIAREFLNQLATGVLRTVEPDETAAEVSTHLREIRRSLGSTGVEGEQRDHGSQVGFLESVIPIWFEEEWANPLRMQPIALAFDSFEAVDRQGGEVVRLIMDVERRLRSQLPELRTVVSGRAAPLSGDDFERYFGSTRRQLDLDGLDEDSGALLLEEEDVRLAGEDGQPVLTDKAMRRNISRVLLGHPLALLIFAQYARSHQGDVADLVTDLERDKGFQAEFAHRFLYERILDRIDDSDVRKLAHPGLVLRQINEDLIRFVLAEPCLDLSSDSAADQTLIAELKSKLENEYWLVEPGDGPFPLRHRPDVRRMMVSGLFANPRPEDTPGQVERKTKLREDALKVCLAARDYFRNGPPQDADQQAYDRWFGLDDVFKRTEALYYEAFLEPDTPADFDREGANELDLALGEDVETLPEAWRARIKVLLDRVLTDVEAENLTEDLVELAEEQEFASAKQHGLSTSGDDFSTLSSTAGRREERRRSLFGETQEEQRAQRTTSQLSREIQLAFSEAQFSQVLSLVTDYADALRHDPEDEDIQSGYSRGFWKHTLWQCLLVSYAHGDEQDLRQSLKELLANSPFEFLPVGMDQVGAGAPVFPRAENNFDLASVRSPVDRLRFSALDLQNWSSFNQNSEPVLSMKSGAKVEHGFMVMPSALCLAAGRRSDDYGRERFHADLPELAGYLEKFWYNDRPYLSDIEGLYRQFVNERPMEFVADTPPKLADLHRRMFRGLNPDLYDPLRTVLTKQNNSVAEEIGAALEKEVAQWPRELWFFEGAEYNPRQAVTLIETADRCGELRALCAHLAKVDEQALPILKMYDLLTDWFFPFAREMG